METYNPYAPSKASLESRTSATDVSSEVRVWRDGKSVVALHDAHLPARCVKCNAPADQPTRVRTVYWHHPALYILFFLWLFVYIIVALIVRKKAEVDPGLCAHHKRRRWIVITLAWLSPVAGIALIIGAEDYPGVVGFASLLILAAIIVGIVLGRVVYAKKITKDEVRLGGFCRAYLDDLPDYPG